MSDDEMDPLDAFMARLELPMAAADGVAHASPTAQRIDWSTATRRRQSPTTQAQDTSSNAVVKNRRYRRLQQLLEGAKVAQDPSQPDAKEANADDWYFSDAMMQQRNPALFHFHLGQYLPSSSSANGGDCSGSRPQPHDGDKSETLNPEELLLSSFLLNTNDRREMEMRRALEQRTWGKFTGHDVDAAAQRKKDLYEQDEEEEEEGEEDSSSDEEEKHNDDDDDANVAADVDVSAAAMHERRQHLVELMAQRFLHGHDGQYVDYAAIDGNEALDDLDQMQRDAEDAYFDMDDD
ncbi:hypothetical protein FI667_g4224, partial [Globisporangium splendens]